MILDPNLSVACVQTSCVRECSLIATNSEICNFFVTVRLRYLFSLLVVLASDGLLVSGMQVSVKGLVKSVSFKIKCLNLKLNIDDEKPVSKN